jgi:hypothetical protein
MAFTSERTPKIKIIGNINNMTIKAVTPAEASKTYEAGAHLPEWVIEAFNEVLIKEFTPYRGGGGHAHIKQEEAMKAVLQKAVDKGIEVTRKQVYDNKWLDVETFYEAAGWKVEYDKPGYNEMYEAFWNFTAKR